MSVVPGVDLAERTMNDQTSGGRQLFQLGAAGVVGPILFTAAYLAQEALRRDEYSPIAETISALEAGPNGWTQQANFVVFGLLTFAFALGLRSGLRQVRPRAVGSTLLCLSGVGLVLAALLPLREDATGATYDPGGHFVAGVIFFMTSALGLTITSRAMARDARWRDLAGYTLAAGIAAGVAFVAGGALVMREGAPLHDFAGLYQRAVLLLVIFPCRILLSVRMLRIGLRNAEAFGS